MGCPSFLINSESNSSRSFFCVGSCIFSSIIARYLERLIIWTFDLIIFENIAGPMSMDGPSHRPCTSFGSGKVLSWSNHFTKSYHSCSTNGDISAVFPDRRVLGTSPWISYMSRAVCYCMRASSSMQWSHSLASNRLLFMLRPDPRLSSLLAPSIMICQGGYGSDCLM